MLWNAVGFTNAGSVRVDSLWTADSRWQVTIQDSGPGIRPEEQERIYYPFYRGEKRVTMPTSGSGLGLTIVHRIVENYDGKVFLNSDGHSGTTFTLHFPLAEENPQNRPQ